MQKTGSANQCKQVTGFVRELATRDPAALQSLAALSQDAQAWSHSWCNTSCTAKLRAPCRPSFRCNTKRTAGRRLGSMSTATCWLQMTFMTGAACMQLHHHRPEVLKSHYGSLLNFAKFGGRFCRYASRPCESTPDQSATTCKLVLASMHANVLYGKHLAMQRQWQQKWSGHQS